MDSIGAIVSVFVLAILVLGGGLVASHSLASSGQTQQQVSDKFSAGSVGSHIVFNASNRDGVYYSSSIAVTASNGDPYIAGKDYTWHRSNGTLTVKSQTLANTSNDQVAFSYRIPSTSQSRVASLVGALLRTGSFLPLLVIVLLIVIALGVLAGAS